MSNDVKLTAKQRMFCQEYIIDLNGTQAAIRAGYSEDTAAVIASENLRKPNIQEYIEEKQRQRAIRVGIDADYVLSETQKLYDMAVEEGSVSNAKAVLELMGKHLKLFTDRVEHEGRIIVNKMPPVIVDDEELVPELGEK